MTRKILVILAVLAVALAVATVSIEAQRGGGGRGGSGGSGGGIAPVSNDNYNGNYDSGNYDLFPGNYDGNYDGNYETVPTVAWVKTYDDGSDDEARGVAVDPRGNVIVTGTSGTIKYDANGNQLWTATGGSGVAADSEGNVVVTGTSNGDYLTIKYDSNGNILWERRYDSGNDADDARGVAIDSEDNVIVTGKIKQVFEYVVPWTPTDGLGLGDPVYVTDST